MSFAAFAGGTTCWDLSLLGRAARAADRGAPTSIFDVRDERRHRPIEVLPEAVRPSVTENCRTWRVTSEVLPDACSSPLRAPQGLEVARELRIPAGVSFNREPPLGLPETREELQRRLETLQPDEGEVSLCWLESAVRASLPRGEPMEQAHVSALVLGPRVSLQLRRQGDCSLHIVAIEDGPEGSGAVANQLFKEAMGEYRDRKAEELARQRETETAHKIAKEKVVFVFGKVLRSSEDDDADACAWDAEGESIVLWRLLQQWLRDTRLRPWCWRNVWLEIEGAGASEVLGFRTRAEADALAGKMWKHAISTLAPTDKASMAMFQTCDLRGVGEVDFESFRDFARRSSELLGLDRAFTEDAARRVFNACDTNGSGRLDASEWKSLFRSWGTPAGSTAAERRIAAVLMDRSLLAVRTTTTVHGDVDLGVACGRGHVIRPLRLRPWGKDLAERWFLGAGFRCAEVDDPIAFAAAWRQRCTRCNAVDSQASFLLSCGCCGDAFGSGWWCTGCVIEAGRPCDTEGAVRAVRCRGGDGQCSCCDQPGTVLWGHWDAAQRLCGEHAADQLLEDAAHASAAGGRDAPDGRSVALRVRLRLRGPLPSRSEGDEELPPAEAFARQLEQELCEVLSLEGTLPVRGQFEVDEVEADAAGGVAVRLALMRAHGRPSPYELFLRLRCLAVDLDGPLYSSTHQVLGTLSSTPVLADLLLCSQPELNDLTSRLELLVDEDRPRVQASGTSLTIWPQTVLPRAASFSVQCARPPENKGPLMAYVLAYPAGTRRSVPPFHEFVEHFEQGKHSLDVSAGLAPASPAAPRPRMGSSKISAPKAGARPKLQRLGSRQKLQKGGRGNRSFCQPDAGCMVALGPGSGDPSKLLHGEATILDLRPDMVYDIFLALFTVRHKDELSSIDVAYQEPVATAQRTLTTPADHLPRFFGSERDRTVTIQTEQLGFARRHCLLELLGLGGLPLIVDRRTCSVSCKPAPGPAVERNKDAMKEHSVTVSLEYGEESLAKLGGWRLPTPCLRAEPSYRDRELELEFSVAADVAVLPCAEHLRNGGLALLPGALTVKNAATRARCCRPGGRCKACRWTRVERTHKLRIKVDVDIVRMAELSEWKSVQKRIEIVMPTEARMAVATMLAARPRLSVDHVMRVFEGAVGRGADVDFPVRADGATALHVAVEEGDPTFVRALLKRRLDPSAVNADGETPLHAAARGGGAEAPAIAEALVQAARTVWRGETRHDTDTEAARQALLDHQDKTGRTVLHIAAAGDQLALVTYLLQAGATPSLRDASGCNVLQAAVAANSVQCTMRLLKVPGVTVDNQTTSTRGCTPLQLACERCHCSLAKQLLECRADPKKAGQSDHKAKQAINFLLEGAALGVRLEGLEDFEELGKTLIERGNPTREMIALAGTAACSFAMRPSADAKVIATCETLLAQLGSLEQAKSPDWAATLGTAMLTAVRRLTVDSNCDRRDDHRVLHAQTPGAWISNLCEIVEFALRAGANPNALTQDKQQDTALTMLFRYPLTHRVLPNDRAAGEAISRTIQTLLKYQANPNCGNRSGERPCTLAKQLLDMGQRYGKAWQQLLSKECAPEGGAPRAASKASVPPVLLGPQTSAPAESPEKRGSRSASDSAFGPTRSLPERIPSQVSLPLLSPGQASRLRRSVTSLKSPGAGPAIDLAAASAAADRGLGSSFGSGGHSGRGLLRSRGGGGGSNNHSARTQDDVSLPALLPTLAGAASPAGLKHRANLRARGP